MTWNPLACLSPSCLTPDCAGLIGLKNRTGYCRSCRAKHLLASPEFRARQRAGVAAYHAQPAVRAASAARMAEWNRNLPEHELERRRDHGRRQFEKYLGTPEGKARSNSPEARKKKGGAISDTRYADIPKHLRDEVRRLNRQQHIPAAEARRLVLEQAAADERRRLAAMTPHDRRLERIRNGARIVEVHPMRRADPAYTLGGVAPEAM